MAKYSSSTKQIFYFDASLRILNPFVADLEEIGIKLNLVVIQNPFDKFIDKTYTLHNGGWTGSSTPSPEGMLHSKYADKIDVTNATSMANSTIDSLIELYNKNWNVEERIPILQKIDINMPIQLYNNVEMLYNLKWVAKPISYNEKCPE